MKQEELEKILEEIKDEAALEIFGEFIRKAEYSNNLDTSYLKGLSRAYFIYTMALLRRVWVITNE